VSRHERKPLNDLHLQNSLGQPSAKPELGAVCISWAT
jgi:hypothetical protein